MGPSLELLLKTREMLEMFEEEILKSPAANAAKCCWRKTSTISKGLMR